MHAAGARHKRSRANITSSGGSSGSHKLRLKCHWGKEIRAVAINVTTVSFEALHQRLSADYGFEVSLKYRDTDGDLIVLSTPNDLEVQFAHTHLSPARPSAFAKERDIERQRQTQTHTTTK